MKKSKRLSAALLTVAMTVTYMPAPVFAELAGTGAEPGELKAVYAEGVEKSVKEISFERAGANKDKPYELIQGVDGDMDNDYIGDDETPEYFQYNFPGFMPGDKIIVNDSVEYIYKSYTDQNNEREYRFVNTKDDTDILNEDFLDVDSNQSYDNQWTKADGNYVFEITYMNCKAEVPAKIVESSVKAVSFRRGKAKSITLNKYIDGDLYYDKTGDEGDSYYKYDLIFKEGDVLTVTRDDGKTDYAAVENRNGEVRRFVNPDNAKDFIYTSEIELDSNQSFSKSWTSSEETYYFHLTYHKCSTEVPVRLTGPEYSKMTFKRANGDTKFSFIEIEDGEKYDYYPVYEEGDTMTLEDEDGNIYTYTYNKTDYYNGFVDEDGNKLNFEECHSSGDWAAGKGNMTFIFCCRGVKASFPVELVEDPIKSVEFSISKSEPYVSFFEEEPDEVYSEYRDGDVITLNYNDGTSKAFVYDEEDEEFRNGKDVLYKDMLSVHKQFRIDPEDNIDCIFEISYYGHSVECILDARSVETNDVVSIALKPVKDIIFVEGVDGDWERGNNNEIYWGYPNLDLNAGDKLTLTRENGEREAYTYRIGNDGKGYFAAVDDETKTLPVFVELLSDQLENETWEAGLHYYTVCYDYKLNSKIPVTVVQQEGSEGMHENEPDVPASCATDETVAHTWNEGKVTKAATTTSEGIKTFKCTKCGAVRTETIPKLERKSQDMTVKGKKVTLKARKLKKKAKKISLRKALSIKGAKGKLSYEIVKVNKKKSKFRISSSGRITAKKGLKKGTYILTVKVTAAGDDDYKPASRTAKVKIKVK